MKHDVRAWWSFAASDGDHPLEGRSGAEDRVIGRAAYGPGVSGTALLLDGLYTHVVRPPSTTTAHPPAKPLRLEGDFTADCWIAPRTYPWNEGGLIAMGRDDPPRGWCLGLDAVGRPIFRAARGKAWSGITADRSISLLTWAHVAVVVDWNRKATLYIDGRPAGEGTLPEAFRQDPGASPVLGRSLWKQAPLHTEREASRNEKRFQFFDGLMDEVRIHDRALSPEELLAHVEAFAPRDPTPLAFRTLPEGPDPRRPAPFGAEYLRLRYDAGWEAPWRVGPWPDLMVRFDTAPVRTLFWRGTNFGPAWITENGLWMGDQSLESGSDLGCNEHMSDKRCRYGRVALLENHDARVVVHWRYPLSDILDGIVNRDPKSGRGDWADEYHVIYPDATAVRHQVLWSTAFGDNWHQFQETLFFNRPGDRPEDTVHSEALTLANLDGEAHTYDWSAGVPARFDRPEKPVIQVVNLRSRWRPFIIFEEGSRIHPFPQAVLEGYSMFPCWNHWPVAQLPNDGRKAPAPDRPSHSSITCGEPVIHEGEGCSHWAAHPGGHDPRCGEGPGAPGPVLEPAARGDGERQGHRVPRLRPLPAGLPVALRAGLP